MSRIHPTAQQGFSSAADIYSRGRPEYPDALREWIRLSLRIYAGTTVVDLGAGTGKLTKLLSQSGARVIPIEPLEAMIAQLAHNLPGISALVAAAQAIPLIKGSVEALVCAQSFHWFATREALLEIHRVLVPGAALGLVWNVRDETCAWVAAAAEIIRPYEGNVPRSYKETWRQAFTGDLFSDLQVATFPHAQVGAPRNVIIDHFLSVSFIAALPAPEKTRVADRLQGLIDTHPDLKDRAEVAFPYKTIAYCCFRH